MPEDQRETFKVTDRRLFNPDGSPREDAAEPQAEPQAVPQPAVPQIPEEPVSQAQEPGPEVDDQFPEEEGELTEFMAVLMEVATPAFIHLGLAEHPATGRPEINLPAGQQAIEMLRILREKTVGNLSPEEEEFFEGLLADLRMRFVSLKKQS